MKMKNVVTETTASNNVWGVLCVTHMSLFKPLKAIMNTFIEDRAFEKTRYNN